MSYKVIDLFAGVGGLSYGFEHDPDFEVVAANEILKPMATAYHLNNPNVKVYNRDIKDLSINDFEKDLGLPMVLTDLQIMNFFAQFQSELVLGI